MFKLIEIVSPNSYFLFSIFYFCYKLSNMDIVLIVIGVALLVIGIIGALVPGIMGPPFSFGALILLHITTRYQFSSEFLFVMGVIAAAVTVLDYVVPVWGTKKFGGTKRGVWGSTIGLIVGIFVLPLLGIVIGPFGILGILLGPFLGAYIAETTGGQDNQQALKAAFGSFIGFLTGTMMKLAYAIIVGVYFFREMIFG